jgi:hypothetical protein
VSNAYAVLGFVESSLDEAKKVFDARANRLDPARVKFSLRPAAQASVAEANEAWGVVLLHLQSGGGPVTYEQPPLVERSWVGHTSPSAPSSSPVGAKPVEASASGWY